MILKTKKDLESLGWKESKFRFSSKHNTLEPFDVAPSSQVTTMTTAPHYYHLLNKYAEGRLVDLGCGNAPLAGVYADRVDGFYWVDWGECPHSLVKPDMECDLNGEIPLQSGSFETVLCSSVLEHIMKPQGLLSEIKRILTPGGRLILVVPFIYGLHEEPYDFYRYTRHQLKNFADELDLKIVELGETGGGILSALDIGSKVFSKHGFLCRSINKLARFVQNNKRLRSWNNRHVSKYPLAYYLVLEK